MELPELAVFYAPLSYAAYDHRHTLGHPLWGVMGPDPRAADLAHSQQLLDQVVDWVCAQVDAQFTSRYM